jgi:hypothetical protein
MQRQGLLKLSMFECCRQTIDLFGRGSHSPGHLAPGGSRAGHFLENPPRFRKREREVSRGCLQQIDRAGAFSPKYQARSHPENHELTARQTAQSLHESRVVPVRVRNDLRRATTRRHTRIPPFPFLGPGCSVPVRSAACGRRLQDGPRNPPWSVLCPFEANALRQCLIGQGDAHRIVGRIGQATESLQEPQRVKDSGVDTHAHGRITRLHPLQR